MVPVVWSFAGTLEAFPCSRYPGYGGRWVHPQPCSAGGCSPHARLVGAPRPDEIGAWGGECGGLLQQRGNCFKVVKGQSDFPNHAITFAWADVRCMRRKRDGRALRCHRTSRRGARAVARRRIGQTGCPRVARSSTPGTSQSGNMLLQEPGGEAGFCLTTGRQICPTSRGRQALRIALQGLHGAGSRDSWPCVGSSSYSLRQSVIPPSLPNS